MLLPMGQIFQEMTAEKLRLSLVILSVAWATVCISSMLAIGEGIRQGVMRTAKSGAGNLIYVAGGIATVDYGTFYPGKSLTLKVEDIKVIKALPDVKNVAPTATWEDPITANGRVYWLSALAISNDFASIVDLPELETGRWLSRLDHEKQRKVVVLGYSVASFLFNPEDDFSWFEPLTLQANPIGKTIKLGSEEFTVIGVFKKSSAWIERGYQSIDESSFVPLTTWQRFHANGDINGINVEPQVNTDRKKLAKTIRQVITRKHGASVRDNEVIQVKDMYLEQKSMQQFLIGLQGFLGIIGFIALAVAGVGIANVMYGTVKRSTRDIGVRMAVGATPTAVRLHYLVQSLITMMLGGVLGLGATYVLVSSISTIDLIGIDIYEQLGKPAPELSWLVVTIVITCLVVIGVASAWLPANFAAKVSPQEALLREY
ncbi:ABC transporter permease [Vibrio ouci]|uniref:ABC transporter permease n=1 Tax=Vibrio ouci TaxID=2499078 RepID=A0A4Y8WJU3_9VIBR|nr:ABC transporter permease [Vibrio ouci]TFH92551.1 ABC transporter permease [Vibrio ouci]